jgi:hypothetical protein
MSKFLKLILLTFALCISTAWAGDFEDGVAAYEKKDFMTALKKFKSVAAQVDASGNFNLCLMYNFGRVALTSVQGADYANDDLR